MAIISPLPYNLANGTNADASQVMADLNQIVNNVNANAATFPTGTRMLFHQTNAPVGWTKETGAAYNDKALRIVTGVVGSGGASDFSATFGGNTGNFTLTGAHIPPHFHAVNIQSGNENANHFHTGVTNDDSPDHAHGLPMQQQGVLQGSGAFYTTFIPGSGTNSDGANTRHQHSFSTGTVSAFHQHAINGATGTDGGGGGAHAHQMPNLAFHDVIIAVKS